MTQQRVAWRVGLFVFIGLVLAGVLVVLFSKGLTLGKPTFEILLRTPNVGGIKRGAAVLMAGVPVGTVRAVELTPDGRAVLLHLRIMRQYSIRSDAEFLIEQAGFLGDQYVSIVATKNEKPFLKDGDMVTGAEPFNLQEAARAATGFLRRVDDTIGQLNGVIERMDQRILSESNLTNVSVALVNLREFTDRARQTSSRLDALIASNAAPVNLIVTNLAEFSESLDKIAADLREAVATNRDQAAATISNINRASVTANRLLDDLAEGRGLAGSVLQDEELRTHWRHTVSNLSVLSSNLTRFGLLYKPSAPQRAPAHPPAAPFQRPF